MYAYLATNGNDHLPHKRRSLVSTSHLISIKLFQYFLNSKWGGGEGGTAYAIVVHSQVSSYRPRTYSYYLKLRGHVIEVKLRSNRMLEQVIDYICNIW